MLRRLQTTIERGQFEFEFEFEFESGFGFFSFLISLILEPCGSKAPSSLVLLCTNK